jgi:hypothetical protein
MHSLRSRTSTFASRFFVLACPVLLMACTQNLNVDSLAPSIIDGIAQQTQIKVASVDCPKEPRPVKAGDTFECTGNIEGGGTVAVAVTQTDDTGNVSWKLGTITGLLDLSKVEASIVGELKKQAAVDATVSCGGKWKSAKRGDAFECEAKAPDGTAIPIVVTVTDDDGNISWATK